MRTSDKKLFLNAVSHRECDKIPFFETQVDIEIACKILEKQLPPHLLSFELPISDYVELNRRLGNDMVFFSHIWRLGRKEMKDAFGRIHYIDGTMKSEGSLQHIWYPDLDRIKRRLEELLEFSTQHGFGIICQVQTAPFVVATAMGYQDYWINAATNPGWIHEFTKRIQDWTLKELELYLSYPIDAIKIGSAFITNKGPMCSPQMLNAFETVYIRQQARLAKQAGKILFLHIDGNISEMVEGFIEMGVDVLNPVEPCDGRQNIYELKKKYGDRIAFCGNIDINGVLLSGSPEEVKQDVIEHIDGLAHGGGYIVASSHDIHQLIPTENLYAMRDAVHEYSFKGSQLT